MGITDGYKLVWGHIGDKLVRTGAQKTLIKHLKLNTITVPEAPQ